MVLLRECGDKLGSARMEGQAFDQRSPQGLGVCQCLIEREKGTWQKHIFPQSSARKRESYRLGRGHAIVRHPL